MRLRVRYQKDTTKFTFKVELQENASFRELKAAVDANGEHVDWRYHVFSLNKKSPLKSLETDATESQNIDDVSVTSTGVANGDLLFIIPLASGSAIAPLVSVPRRETPTEGSGNLDALLPVDLIRSSVPTVTHGASGIAVHRSSTKRESQYAVGTAVANHHGKIARSSATTVHVHPRSKDTGMSVPEELRQRIAIVLNKEAQLSLGLHGPSPAQYRAAAVFTAMHAMFLNAGLYVQDSIMQISQDGRGVGEDEAVATGRHWSTKSHATYWATYTSAASDSGQECTTYVVW